jgi:hypothetical protein
VLHPDDAAYDPGLQGEQMLPPLANVKDPAEHGLQSVEDVLPTTEMGMNFPAGHNVHGRRLETTLKDPVGQTEQVKKDAETLALKPAEQLQVVVRSHEIPPKGGIPLLPAIETEARGIDTCLIKSASKAEPE